MDKPRRGLSLASRMFLSTGLIVLVAVGVAVAVTSVLGERIGARAARERIVASSSLQSSFQQQRFQQLELTAELMAGNPEFKAYLNDALANADRLSVLDQLEERAADLGYDLALFVRPDGSLVARTDQPDAVGANLSSRPLVRKVREEYEAAGIWQEGPRLYEAVAVPVALGPNLLGYLAVGYRIGDVRALEVKRGTGSDVLFLTAAPAGAAPVASTLTSQEIDRLLGALRLRGDLLARVTQRGEAVEGVDLELAGVRWTALLAPLQDAGGEPVGALVSLASLDRELAGYRNIRNLLIAAGILALAAALALSWWVSRRTMGPVSQLVGAIAAARRGDLDVAVPKRGAGEVVALATAFNRLLADLREKRDMAEYVQKLSRSLPEPAAAPTRALPVGRAETVRTILVGIELPRYATARAGADPGPTLDRLSRDLRKIATLAMERGGRLETVSGQRALLSFTGPSRAEQSFAAAAEIAAAVAARENVFDEAEPPVVAIVSGEVVTGPVSWGSGADRTLLGLPIRQLEGLLREAGPGDIALAPAVHADLAATFERAGLALEPQRGLLSTQPIYLLSATEAARVAGVDPEQVTRRTASGSIDAARATLSGISPGTLLGARFEILRALGSGGMGMVFKARDRELDDLVALKMLKPEVAGDARLVERLKSELKLARKITHPNVLRTFDFGEIEGLPYISMEYVRGLTLREMLTQSGRLPYSAGLRLSRQLLSGLSAAHDMGILHRDIKPENIILDATGAAKLMDFGLARPVDRVEAGQTQAGFIVGTPHYLAPEQLQGLDPLPAADVYACGVVLYEVFTGQLPFGGGNPMEILLLHMKEPPTDPREHWPEMPPTLRQILLTCLEKDPAARYAAAGTLLAELEKL